MSALKSKIFNVVYKVWSDLCVSILIFLLSHLTNFSYRWAWRLCIYWNDLSSILYVADSYLITRFNFNVPSLEKSSSDPKVYSSYISFLNFIILTPSLWPLYNCVGAYLYTYLLNACLYIMRMGSRSVLFLLSHQHFSEKMAQSSCSVDYLFTGWLKGDLE